MKIVSVFEASRKTYGALRVWKVLLRNGVSCSRGQVSKIMLKNWLISVYTKKRKSLISTTDSSKTVAPAKNILNRNSSAKSINEKWVDDVTYVRTPEGWLYFASVMDLFSRK